MRKTNRFMSVLVGTLIVVCICGCGRDTSHYVQIADSTEETEKSEEEEAVVEVEENLETFCYIYVCGEVKEPGVYTLPAGSRVCDVFEKAGGFTENAATDYWNQARLIVDGEMIYVPTKEEAEERNISAEDSKGVETDNTGKININTASKEQLMSIPGIGEAKAMAIIAYRKENGSFSDLEEVKQVEGIKDGVFAKMKEYIVIN